ncbi:hypothetical protein H257_18814 [Aphanomyces astaci]|uniref:Uncharacterized protein n=1 Tax=Aphanomyces astaci TaxID=112090 RepID=W4FBT8_APHAT|nr:hypothetical protein H257_18814 [Aphanomyces astaci]ETV64276.1 hypothetical protein H257_18814 [Aphanomyces astaci]|eukprot:XP_009846242.1 hypothetical protein H257_18814 [Aphanomyces astaci]
MLPKQPSANKLGKRRAHPQTPSAETQPVTSVQSPRMLQSTSSERVNKFGKRRAHPQMPSAETQPVTSVQSPVMLQSTASERFTLSNQPLSKRAKRFLDEVQALRQQFGVLPSSNTSAQSQPRLNSLFAFTSIGANETQLPPGPPVYKIRGQMIHRIGSYEPLNGKPRSFAQVYVLDSDDQMQLRTRMASNLNCSAAELIIAERMQSLISKHNAFATL